MVFLFSPVVPGSCHPFHLVDQQLLEFLCYPGPGTGVQVNIEPGKQLCHEQLSGWFYRTSESLVSSQNVG